MKYVIPYTREVLYVPLGTHWSSRLSQVASGGMKNLCLNIASCLTLLQDGPLWGWLDQILLMRFVLKEDILVAFKMRINWYVHATCWLIDFGHRHV